VKYIAKSGDFIVTWGGRQYYVEPSMLIGNRMVDFSYKLLNYYIQGSSADITKEALIRYDAARQHGRMILSVYDEVDISCPKDKIKQEMLLLRDVMLSIETDVPLLSDGEVGKNLGALTKLKEPAFDLSRWSIK
jgi:DNA polymerase I-like protein with 3'-5' exonuclease and polymerase domains